MWADYSHLICVPTDIRKERNEFFRARKEFSRNRAHWKEKSHTIELKIQQALSSHNIHELSPLSKEITPHILLALIEQEGIKPKKSKKLSITSKVSGSSFIVVLSKPDTTAWPFSSILSLEIELKLSPEQANIAFTRLRKGAQELNPGLIWAYFGSDIDLLKSITHVLARLSQGLNRSEELTHHETGIQHPAPFRYAQS